MSNNISPVDPETFYALIVGIGNYKDSRIPALNYTHADAHSFYDLVLDSNHAGLKPENVKLLIDDQASLANIKKAVSTWLFKETNHDSTVLVFFAGHGGIESDKTGMEPDGISKYILPWDCDKDDLFSSSLSSNEFNRLLATIKSKRMVFFMDACYAGGVSQTGARDVGIEENLLEKLTQGEGRIVIASAKGSQRSWENQTIGHGIFTYHLLEALSGKADIDNDGYVTIWEVFKYLEKMVPQSVRQLAQSLQEPLLSGDISKDIYLTVNADRVKQRKDELLKKLEEQKTIARERQRKLFDLYQEGEIQSDIYEEGLKLLSKNAADLDSFEIKLFKNLEALLRGGITADMYADNRQALIDARQKEEPAKPRSHDENPEVKKKTEKKYCTNCGAPVFENLVFCTACGEKV